MRLRGKARFLVPVLGLIGLVAIAGCGGPTQASNAAEFRQQVQQLGYEVELLPARADFPGLVEGISTTKGGVEGRFSYSFGPDMRQDVPREAKVGSIAAISAGVGMFNWTQDFPLTPNPDNRQINQFYDMKLEIEDTACRVLVDKPCGVGIGL